MQLNSEYTYCILCDLNKKYVVRVYADYTNKRVKYRKT